ncbi:MAG: Ni/Fe hydrogenase subunit alpha [Thermoleophilia bacterium]
MGRMLTIDPVTRIEGHARVALDLDDAGGITRADLIVNELRGFERILVGMEAEKMPQITARICGVCPSAHHLAAVKALENALGVDPPPAAKLMRELLYMGHFIHSHTLHLFVLAGPDLVLGLDGDPAKRNIVGVVEAVPEVALKALRLRSLGQKLNELIGGRGVHPVTAIIGGMSFDLDEQKLAAATALVDEALELALELATVAKDLINAQATAHPALLTDLQQPTWYMGTVKAGKVNFYDGRLRVIDDTGMVRAEFDAPEYGTYLAERTVESSYLKPVFMNVDGQEHVYRVNTLARMNVAEGMETPKAQSWFEAFRKGLGWPCHLTVPHNYARIIELIYACEKAKEIVSDPAVLGSARIPVTMKAGHGVGHVEAPRGSLFHEYEIDDNGIVQAANLIVATQQNYSSINTSILQAAQVFVAGRGEDAILNAVEFAIRSYDPCLSCATHAVGRMPLIVEMRRDGETVHLMRRDA